MQLIGHERLELHDDQKCRYVAGNRCSATTGSCRARRHTWLKAKWLYQECVKQSSSCLAAAIEGHASLTVNLILITAPVSGLDSHLSYSASAVMLCTNSNAMLLLQTAMQIKYRVQN